MTFSTISFLFVFFPAAILLCMFMPKKLQNPVLLLASLFFYAWGSPKGLLLLVLTILFNYFAGLEIGAISRTKDRRSAKLMLASSVVVHLAILAFYKYSGAGLPIGISFYTFSELSYLFDIYQGSTEAERNPLTLALYISFFPKVTSGPIVEYRKMKDQLADRQVTRADAGAGLNMFLIGLFKKVLLADNLGKFFSAVTGLQAMSAGTAWLGMIFYSLQLYFDFSGYSDMAIGISRMLGFRLEANFDYPYISASITEFWRRWHISLGAWFRDYVYIPLGGNREGQTKQIRNLMVVWALTGIWHGSTLNFLFWGLYHGVIIVLERFVLHDMLELIPRPVRILLTDLAAFVGWVFFFSPSLGSAFRYIGRMLGLDGLGFVDGTMLYYLRGSIVLLIAAVLCCGPNLKKTFDGLMFRRRGSVRWVSVGVYTVLLVFSIAAIVGSTYTTFLYFQF